MSLGFDSTDRGRWSDVLETRIAQTDGTRTSQVARGAPRLMPSAATSMAWRTGSGQVVRPLNTTAMAQTTPAAKAAFRHQTRTSAGSNTSESAVMAISPSFEWSRSLSR